MDAHFAQQFDPPPSMHKRPSSTYIRAGNSPVEDTTNPPHYRNHPSGVQCIEIAEHFCYNLGNVIKYTWRAGLKDNELDDLRKARWYLDREIATRTTKP